MNLYADVGFCQLLHVRSLNEMPPRVVFATLAPYMQSVNPREFLETSIEPHSWWETMLNCN